MKSNKSNLNWLEQIFNAIKSLGESLGVAKQSNWNETDTTSPSFIQNKPQIPAAYTLPTASAETLGGVKVGSGLAITEGGVLSASGGGALIVEGTVENSEFTPNEGQPSFEDAVEAISEGRDVIIYIPDEEGNAYYHWTECDMLNTGTIVFGLNINW